MSTASSPEPPRRPGLDLRIERRAGGPAPALRELRPWLCALLAEVAPDARSFALRLTSDREVRRLNHLYRGTDRTTDVLSFPGAGGPEGRHLGDVVIALPTARRQAQRAGHSLALEVRELVLHGVLHCLGYDHVTDDGAMRRRELRLRRRWTDDDG